MSAVHTALDVIRIMVCRSAFGAKFKNLFISDDSNRKTYKATKQKFEWQTSNTDSNTRRTWLCTIEQDLRPLNIGLVSAWQRAQDRERWKRTVATLQTGECS